MTDEKKKMPKGGRKGGKLFPRIPLARAVAYAKKLVSKTQTGPLPDTIILKGVFGTSGPNGGVRASALKQFNLLTGERAGYEATELAKKINSATPEDLPALLRESCLEPKLFKALYNTFQTDVVTRARVRQQALSSGVHPDVGDEAANIFCESIVCAGLGAVRGEDIEVLAATAALPPSTNVGASDSDEGEGIDTEDALDETQDTDGILEDSGEEALDPKDASKAGGNPARQKTQRSPVEVNLSLDSTIDPDKLEKTLKLLKRYRVI